MDAVHKIRGLAVGVAAVSALAALPVECIAECQRVRGAMLGPSNEEWPKPYFRVAECGESILIILGHHVGRDFGGYPIAGAADSLLVTRESAAEEIYGGGFRAGECFLDDQRTSDVVALAVVGESGVRVRARRAWLLVTGEPRIQEIAAELVECEVEVVCGTIYPGGGRFRHSDARAPCRNGAGPSN